MDSLFHMYSLSEVELNQRSSDVLIFLSLKLSGENNSNLLRKPYDIHFSIEVRDLKQVFRVITIWILVFFIFIHIELPTYAEEKPVKNVIFMIPDGFSTSYATAYRWYKGEATVFDSIFVGMHRTYSANSSVTDSAASGTAMATGVKTKNGMIGINPKGKQLTTILQASKQAGKKTGLVTTVPITNATPASFVAKVENRNSEKEIAKQLIRSDVDVLLGGGKEHFPPLLLQEAGKRGYQFAYTQNDLARSKFAEKLLGLFAPQGLTPALENKKGVEPSLADMTDVALSILSKHEKGFFLMIEGGQIDWAGHANDAAWALMEIAAFEQALELVLEFAKRDGETLVVVASDHDTGGFSVGGYDKNQFKVDVLRNIKATGQSMAKKLNKERSNVKQILKKFAQIELTEEEMKYIQEAENPTNAINQVISKRACVGWTTHAHTGVDVPVYAYGPFSHLFVGLHNNTDLPKLMAKALGIQLN